MQPPRKSAVGIVLGFIVAGSALAGPLEEANAAYGRGDYPAAVRQFRSLAEQGDPEAQLALAEIYFRGDRGLPQDHSEGVRWVRMAADQGYTAAQVKMGSVYRSGAGVPQDFSEAARWYRLAADRGDSDGQFALGVLYEEGRGVPRDFALAYMWFNLATAGAPNKYIAGMYRKRRDGVAAQLPPADLNRAQQMSTAWRPK